MTSSRFDDELMAITLLFANNRVKIDLNIIPFQSCSIGKQKKSALRTTV